MALFTKGGDQTGMCHQCRQCHSSHHQSNLEHVCIDMVQDVPGTNSSNFCVQICRCILHAYKNILTPCLCVHTFASITTYMNIAIISTSAPLLSWLLLCFLFVLLLSPRSLLSRSDQPKHVFAGSCRSWYHSSMNAVHWETRYQSMYSSWVASLFKMAIFRV